MTTGDGHVTPNGDIAESVRQNSKQRLAGFNLGTLIHCDIAMTYTMLLKSNYSYVYSLVYVEHVTGSCPSQ